jgi:hypothetical protein
VLQRVDQQPRALRNEIGVQRLAPHNLLAALTAASNFAWLASGT